MQRLTNKTCVVTGAASGIGRAIAASFHDEGAIVIVMLASDEGTCITGTEITIDGGLLAGSAASPG